MSVDAGRKDAASSRHRRSRAGPVAFARRGAARLSTPLLLDARAVPFAPSLSIVRVPARRHRAGGAANAGWGPRFAGAGGHRGRKIRAPAIACRGLLRHEYKRGAARNAQHPLLKVQCHEQKLSPIASTGQPAQPACRGRDSGASSLSWAIGSERHGAALLTTMSTPEVRSWGAFDDPLVDLSQRTPPAASVPIDRRSARRGPSSVPHFSPWACRVRDTFEDVSDRFNLMLRPLGRFSAAQLAGPAALCRSMTTRTMAGSDRSALTRMQGFRRPRPSGSAMRECLNAPGPPPSSLGPVRREASCAFAKRPQSCTALHDGRAASQGGPHLTTPFGGRQERPVGSRE